MPAYRIYRLKEPVRRQFRWAPHTAGLTVVKPRDYEPDGSVEAAGLYSAWAALRSTATPLGVGDLLETETGTLFICKYVGFEQARWERPEAAAAGAWQASPASGSAGETTAPAPYDDREVV